MGAVDIPLVVVVTLELAVPPLSPASVGTVICATFPSTADPENVTMKIDVSATDVSRVTVRLLDGMFERDSSATRTSFADAGAVNGDDVVTPLYSRSNVPLVAPIVRV
jgi:hypothetical protein